MKFLIKTHGCKANQLESAVITEKLVNEGYELCNSAKDADIYILNSCSVTETADIEALRTLRNIKHKNPNILTVLTGCSAQLRGENLAEFDYIDIILGNNDKFDIVNKIKSKTSTVTDIFKVENFNNQLIHTYSKTRGYLKIQDGCNNYCSYCTIPYARGKSRSNSIENILEQIKIYTDTGIKEIVLTGIHIGQWGEDFNSGAALYNLLEAIESTQIERYRLGSLNPLEIDERLINFLSQSDKFCPHFHLSIQSLTNKTLENMNRHYSAECCLELIEKLNNNFKLPFLGSDIIVGFPQESDKDFETTVENAKKSGLSSIHVFPYSVRSNTKAAQMSGQVDEHTKHERASILHKITDEKINEFINKNIGMTAQVLVEKRPDKHTGLAKGVTKNYLNVYIENHTFDIFNTIQNVKILNRKDDKLFCNII